jgi:putative membrane protein
MKRTVAAALAVLAATPALAHLRDAATDHGPGWTWDPWITGPLALSALLFAAGWRRLRARSAGGRRALAARGVLFALGWLVMAGALVSPLHEAGERSFAAHMLEHELLMLVGAPLLVLAEPLAVMLWAFPATARAAIGRVTTRAPVRPVWRGASEPITATLLQAAALWLWHVPALFDRALASEGWHVAQHLSFIVTALLFWTAMLGRRGQRSGQVGARGVAALCLFATSVVSGALGALMAVSESPWYEGYARLGLAPFDLTPLEDQQLAGLLMWVPGGLVHALAALVVVRTLMVTPRDVEVADAA